MRSRDQFKKITGIAGIVGVLVVSAGCGGGGGGSAPSTGGFAIPNDLTVLKPGVVSTISNTLVAWQTGDEWYYSIGGQLRNAANQIETIHHGYSAVTIGAPTDAGEPGFGGPGALTMTDQRYIYFASTKVSSNNLKTYLNDGATGHIEVGDTAEKDGNMEYVGNDICDPAGGFQVVPTNFDITTGFSGGSAFYVPTGIDKTTACGQGSTLSNQEQVTFTVLDQEQVTVPAGTFQVWKVRSTRNYIQQGIKSVDVAYWAPQIGGYVEIFSERDGTDGHESYQYQLIGFKSRASQTVPPLVKAK